MGITGAIIASSLIAAGTSTAGSVIGSKAATGAAKTQAEAAEQIRLQAQEAAKTATGEVNQSTESAKQTLTAAQEQRLAALKPYIDQGLVSLKDLGVLLSDEGPLGEGNKFTFSSDKWRNDPGYEFVRQQGEQQAKRVAAASGTLFTGGTMKGLSRFNTGLADTQLNSAFQRAIQEYQVNRQNTLARVQGLQGLTGLGYNAVGTQDQVIGDTSRTIAANEIMRGRYAGDVGLDASRIAAEAISGKANAEAAGKVGSANAWTAGLSGIGNAAQTAAILYSMPRVTQPGQIVNQGGFIPGVTDAEYTGLNARKP